MSGVGWNKRRKIQSIRRDCEALSNFIVEDSFVDPQRRF